MGPLIGVAAYSGCQSGGETAPPAGVGSEPPAVSGGTLAVTPDGGAAVAADPDRDRVWLIDLADRGVKEIALDPGDEPGRVALDASGRAHVALRGGGAVVTIDLASAEVIARRPVCAAPRGIAFDEARDALHVACLGGELVTLPAGGGEPTRSLRLNADLRDVAVAGDALLVSRFRAAELLVIDAEGVVVSRRAPPPFERHLPAKLSIDVKSFSASVAWRAAPLPGGGVAMVHQRGQEEPILLDVPQGYSPPDAVEDGVCADGIVHSAVTIFDAAGAPGPMGLRVVPESTLPVDVAVSPDGSALAIVGAGSRTVTELWTAEYRDEAMTLGPCTSAVRSRHQVPGLPVAAAYTPGGALAVQIATPPSLVVLAGGEARVIDLPAEAHDSPGHALFHAAAQGTRGLACASCHPEGGEDGRTWVFSPIGPRRTQHLRGGISSSAPFHWDGDILDLEHLLEEVLVRRMGGAAPDPNAASSLASWLDAQARWPASPPRDPEAAERGRALFESAEVGCADCHAGSQGSGLGRADVGTGAMFEKPRLVDVAARGPWMHDGCAKTLRERFDPDCGGAQHGRTEQLTEGEIDDLVAHLETL